MTTDREITTGDDWRSPLGSRTTSFQNCCTVLSIITIIPLQPLVVFSTLIRASRQQGDKLVYGASCMLHVLHAF